MHFSSSRPFALPLLSHHSGRSISEVLVCTCPTEFLKSSPNQMLIKEWHHIPSTMKEADDCTRGKEMHEQTLKCQWISGPEFLMLLEEGWLSSKEDLHVNKSEFVVKAPVLTTSTSPDKLQ